MGLAVDHDAAADRLVELYAERIRLAHAMATAERPTRVDAEAVLAAGRALTQACEAFRRRHYPRRAEVIVGLYQVIVCSPSRRRTVTVYDGTARHAPVTADRG